MTKTFPEKSKLIKEIQEKSILFGNFRLAHAGKKDFYINAKTLTHDADSLWLIGKIIYKKIKNLKVDAIGGMEIGSIPISTVVSMNSLKNGKISLFTVRKKAKSHGTKRDFEGTLNKGDRVVVIDDVVSTGNSIVEAIERIKKQGVKVVKVISVVDRELGGREAIEKCGCEYEPLLTIEDLEIDKLRKKKKKK